MKNLIIKMQQKHVDKEDTNGKIQLLRDLKKLKIGKRSD